MRPTPIDKVAILTMRNATTNYVETSKNYLQVCLQTYIPDHLKGSPEIKDNMDAATDITDEICDHLDDLLVHPLFTKKDVDILVVGDLVGRVHTIGEHILNLERLFNLQLESWDIYNPPEDFISYFSSLKNVGRKFINMMGIYLDETTLISLGFTKKEIRRHR